MKRILSLLLSSFLVPVAFTADVDVKDLSVNGGVAPDGKAKLTIEGTFGSPRPSDQKVLFSTGIRHHIAVSREKITNTLSVTLDVLQGDPKEFTLTIGGEGDIKQVIGEALLDWGIRQAPDGARVLILRPKKGDKPLERMEVTVIAERDLREWKSPVAAFTLTPPQPGLSSGFVKVDGSHELSVRAEAPSGLLPMEQKFLPEALRGQTKPEDPEPLSFQFHGGTYVLPLNISVGDPETRQVVLRDFKLVGQLNAQSATFTLTATARVANPTGGSISLLSGGVGLTEVPQHPDWRLTAGEGNYVLRFNKAGEYPLQFKFNAVTRASGPWNAVDFRVASSALQPVVLQGLAADTQFDFAGAAKPERAGNDFTSFLPPDGTVKLAWKNAPTETEGRLFYSAEMLMQIGVSPGLVRQVVRIDGKVMQGELTNLVLVLRGAGEVTRVVGDQVLAWDLKPGAVAEERKLTVQFNQPQKADFALQVQTQTPIGAFPQTFDALQIRPENATRFAGYARVLNQGAVRLEVVQSKGLSQVSPEQFPETDATKNVFRIVPETQRFAYRFSGADFSLRIAADQILPELTVSEVLAYHHGETELSAEAEFEVDIREAPLRELLLRVPKGYAVAKLNAPGMTDYFQRDADETATELRIVYGQPVTGRQVVQLRMEQNKPPGAAEWVLPRMEVVKAKSVRGSLGVSADTGFRLTPAKAVGLTELATAFFPRKVAGLQATYRIAEPGWQATLRIERLPQSVQVDALHLFSIGEGVAYGSSVLNYVITGSPVAALKVELSSEYGNVEFVGKDLRSWEKAEGGYLVHLHTPVSGAYTLLATYERGFKAQGDTLSFAGARPMEVQSEQGHTLVTSAYQFQVQPVSVSASLLRLEPGEVPAEYRLLFDAPILAAYRYTARPFDLKLQLSPLAQGDSISQVVDRASLATRISKEGQFLTDASYFVKSRRHTHFRLQLPEGTQLWSATVNDAPVVPVADNNANLIPIPQLADPNAVLAIKVKLASRANDARVVRVETPTVSAPVMLAEWKVTPDTGQRISYRGGSLTPVGGAVDTSGFGGLMRMLQNETAPTYFVLVAALGLFVLAILAWKGGTRSDVYRNTPQHSTALVIGALAFLIAVGALFFLGSVAKHHDAAAPAEITFVAPVQQSGSSLTAEISNVSIEKPGLSISLAGISAVAAVIVWGVAFYAKNPVYLAVGWILLAASALAKESGAQLFFVVLALFAIVNCGIPAVRRLMKMPEQPIPPAPPNAGGTAATAALLIGALMISPFSLTAQEPPKAAPVAETVSQQIRVEEKFAFATAKIRWAAERGQRLPLLYAPAVLTKAVFPEGKTKLVQATVNERRAHHLLAIESGTFDVELQYQIGISRNNEGPGITLPTQFGLVNSATLTIANLDVDVFSPGAVSVDRSAADKSTVATVVLMPTNDIWIGWKPRSRDVAKEKSVFHAELTQLAVPTVGVIEGLHHAFIKPAQGELAELTFLIPKGVTITDVVDPATLNARDQAPPASIVSQWRFDPDAGKLRIALNPSQSRPFSVVVRSQVATGPLPVTQTIGLISPEGAATHVGMFGIATGNEVQLETVTSDTLQAINLEDYPPTLATALAGQVPGITVRRAFRYSDPKATASITASAVAPDTRVESRDTLSLGEDRVVLASNADVEITRAGIFRLSFPLPAGLDVESISGESMSHWTEAKNGDERIITIHLKGRTEGRQQFAISLSGAGLKTAKAWKVPQVIFREASKQRGSFVVAPEQGMRLQVAAREGVTQLDPAKSGIRQKGVLAFRVLQTPWSVTLDVEQVEAWVQVTSLQHALISESQVKVTANLQYQIENTGLKTLRVELPTDAENARFTGDQVADFMPVKDAVNGRLQTWEVKLSRRVIGSYLLQATYQTPVAAQAAETSLVGVRALDVNLQRGYATVQSTGRLQLHVEVLPSALQAAEWQSIPRGLQKDLSASAASFAYRLVEPAFVLPIRLQRHEAAKLLPARVNSITLTSVIADSGAMLTQVTMDMLPGDKRLLAVNLPKDALFWFAYVNQNGVWPWRSGDEILVPLEQQSRSGKSIPVTFFYSSQIGNADPTSLDLGLEAPQFDLPLENIVWNIYLNEKWRLKKWTGSLQKKSDEVVKAPEAVDVQRYLQTELTQKREKTRAAEQELARGNKALEQGDPQQARRAFGNAFELSQHDAAFNEDARVQLHNVKLQQALVGLNVRRNDVAGATDALANKLRASGLEPNYTQQDAKQLLDNNSADENAVLTKLAERLIQQQDAAVSAPAVIQASIPEQGRLLTFGRSVAVDPQAALTVDLEMRASGPASLPARIVTLLVSAALIALAAWSARAFFRS